MLKKTIIAAAMCAAATMPAQAAVSWDFNFTDAVGVGFNDGAVGTDRQNALISAGDYLSGFLTSYDTTLKIDVDGSVADGSTLAAAGSEFNAAAAGGFNNKGDVMLKVLGGDAADPNPGARDGTVTWNFSDFMWELASDFQAGEYDFFSTAVHELLHALGFSSDIAQNGEDTFGNVGGTAGQWTPFDESVADAVGTSIIDSSAVLDLTRWGDASVSASGTPGCGTGLSFNGTNAVAANGGNPIEIYSPSTWEDGSSGSHIDDQCYSGTYMMEAATNAGLSTRTISAVEIGTMRDIGYTQFGVTSTGGGGTSVPVPAVVYLLAGGLGLMAARRKMASV